MKPRKTIYSLLVSSNDNNRNIAEVVISVLLVASVLTIGVAVIQPLIK